MPLRSEPVERMCLVTRQVRPVDELIRFVLDPEGRVVADLRHRLPGRGVWLSADAATVAEAERKRLFARGFKEPAVVDPGLADRVGEMLGAAALASVSFARKAGELVLGFAKVEAAIARGGIAALLEASDGGEDGVKKIAAAVRRRDGPPVSILRPFTSEQLSLALGRPHVIHAALLVGRASQNVIDQIAALDRFLSGKPPAGAIFHPSLPTAEPAAGH